MIETIYIDDRKHCHRINDGNMIAVETDFFIDRCDTWVEGYVYDDSKGYVQIYPWQPYAELDSAQREYERQRLAECEAELAELDALILDQQYNSLMEDL